MKKVIYTIAICFFLINCENSKNEKAVSKNKMIQSFLTYRMSQQKFSEIDIDTLQHFGDILNFIDTTDCRYFVPLIKLETDSIIYKIQHLHVFCEAIFDYKMKEIIYLNTDSIAVNHRLSYPISELKNILINHLVNPTHHIDFPSENQRRLISIHIDSSKSIKETKKLLLKTISIINSLNVEHTFAFMFDRYGMIQEVPF